MKRKYVLILFGAIALYGLTYFHVGTTATKQTPQPVIQPRPTEPSCTFLLYGMICSNVPQGGGGTLHAVYM